MKKINPIIIPLLVGIFLSACDVREETKQPVACFTASSTQIMVGETVEFSSECSTDAKTFQWDFGNNNTSVALNPSHRFDEVGEHVVTLIVVNRNLRDEATKVITVVEERNPVASFTYNPIEPFVGNEVSFTNISVDADTYAWDFGDGTTSSDNDPIHVYQSANNYTVVLTAFAGDKSNQMSKDISVSDSTTTPETVTADFTYSPATPLTYEYVYFTNASSNADSYKWEFGDGGESTDVNPIRYYSSSGEYNVTLTAYRGDESDVVTYMVKIYDELEEFDPTVYQSKPIGGWDVHYKDDFEEDKGDWSIKDEGGVSSSISDGYYNIQLSGTGGSWYFWSTGAELPSSDFDYDIDTYITVVLDDSTYGSGLVWGIDTEELSANDFKITNYQGELWYTVGDPDYYWLSTASGWDNLYGLYLNENLLSVRKYGDKFYVFLNEMLIVEHDYQVFGNNFGFYVEMKSNVKIDLIAIHTMNFSSKKSGKTKVLSGSYNAGQGQGVAKMVNEDFVKKLK